MPSHHRGQESWDLGEEDNPTCLKPEAETRMNCRQVQPWVPHSSHIRGIDGSSQPVLCLHLCHWDWTSSSPRSGDQVSLGQPPPAPTVVQDGDSPLQLQAINPRPSLTSGTPSLLSRV